MPSVIRKQSPIAPMGVGISPPLKDRSVVEAELHLDDDHKHPSTHLRNCQRVGQDLDRLLERSQVQPAPIYSHSVEWSI